MTHVLHLIKDPANRAALDSVARQARDASIKLSVVLLHDAVRLREPLPGEVFWLDEGRGDGGSAPYPSISHGRLLDLIFAADSVVTW